MIIHVFSEHMTRPCACVIAFPIAIPKTPINCPIIMLLEKKNIQQMSNGFLIVHSNGSYQRFSLRLPSFVPPFQWENISHLRSTQSTWKVLKCQRLEHGDHMIYVMKTYLSIPIHNIYIYIHISCTYVCVYIYIYTCIYLYTYMYIYIRSVCIYGFIHVYVCVCVCIRIRVYTSMCIHIYIYTCVDVCVYIYIYYVCTYVYIYIERDICVYHVCIYIYMYIYFM